MKTPAIDSVLAEWLRVRFDNPARTKDTDNEIRWKAAQRAVVLDIQAIHEAQRGIKVHSNTKIKNNSDLDPRCKD